jgi:hypothetical protein
VGEPLTRPSAVVIAACVVAAVLGGALAALGATELVGQRRLDREGVSIMARVTDARIASVKSTDSYELRYAFEAPGRRETFTLADGTGRANLWATADGQPEWEQAQQTGAVAVRYLPRDPRVNRLARGHGHPIGDAAAGIGIGAFVAALGLLIGGLEAAKRGGRWRAVVSQVATAIQPRR